MESIARMKTTMPRAIVAGFVAGALVLATAHALGQVAGTFFIGEPAAQVQAVAVGWSAKKQIIGHAVYNEAGDNVGKIEDLIVTPANAISFAIVGTGGFVGIRRHHVAIPVSELTPHAGDFVLPGATREAIMSLPPFEYED